MPVAALGLDAATCADLARAGLRRVGDLALRPRAPIAARFGADVIARLDALAGEERGAISPRFTAARAQRRAAFRQPDSDQRGGDGDAGAGSPTISLCCWSSTARGRGGWS